MSAYPLREAVSTFRTSISPLAGSGEKGLLVPRKKCVGGGGVGVKMNQMEVKEMEMTRR